MDDTLRKKIDDFVRGHHHVIHSPISRDTLLVPNPDKDGDKFIRKSKLLLQCSIRELHSDMYKPPSVGLGDLVRDSDGNRLVSDTVFRSLLPPELRIMTGQYKLMCCCAICQGFDYKHSALNRFRLHLLKDLESEYKDLPSFTRSEKLKKDLAKIKYHKYKLTAFNDDEPLHPRGRHASECIQCPSPDDFEETGITRMKCARGLCDDCGIETYSRPSAEEDTTKVIRWYEYQKLPTCSHCGAQGPDAIVCSRCPPKKRQTLQIRNHLVLQEETFPIF